MGCILKIGRITGGISWELLLVVMSPLRTVIVGFTGLVSLCNSGIVYIGRADGFVM